MLKRVLALVLCCLMIVSLSACGSDEPKTKDYTITNSLGTQIDVSLLVGLGTKVKTDGDSISISTRAGDVKGKALTFEDINSYRVDHYNDMDFFEYTINGFDCFGYGGEGEGATAFTHVIVVSDNAGVILVAASQDAMYDAEATVTFSVKGAVASTESEP